MPVKVTRIINHSLTQSNLWQACHPVPVICSCCYLSNRWQTNTCEQKTCHSGSHSNTFTQSFLELEVTRVWKNSFQKSLHHTVLFLPPSPSFCSISPPTFPPDSWIRHTQEYQELPHNSRGNKTPMFVVLCECQWVYHESSTYCKVLKCSEAGRLDCESWALTEKQWNKGAVTEIDGDFHQWYGAIYGV